MWRRIYWARKGIKTKTIKLPILNKQTTSWLVEEQESHRLYASITSVPIPCRCPSGCNKANGKRIRRTERERGGDGCSLTQTDDDDSMMKRSREAAETECSVARLSCRLCTLDESVHVVVARDWGKMIQSEWLRFYNLGR